jgi:hypothetical protein
MDARSRYRNLVTTLAALASDGDVAEDLQSTVSSTARGQDM